MVLMVGVRACDGVFGLEHIKADARPAAVDAATGYPAAVLADHPAAYWRLGAASVLGAVDQSGRGNGGTFAGGAVPGAGGAILGDADTAVMFDGVDDAVKIGDRLSFEGTDPFTLEAWVKPTMHAAYLGIVSKADEDSGGLIRRGYHCYSQYMVAGCERNDGNGIEDVRTGKLPLDTWSYFVATYGAGTFTLYVDGVAQATRTPTASILIPPTSASFTIGARAGGVHSFFIGVIDEVAVYDYPLSLAQIDEHRRVALGL
jgi:hypothetical protein